MVVEGMGRVALCCRSYTFQQRTERIPVGTDKASNRLLQRYRLYNASIPVHLSTHVLLACVGTNIRGKGAPQHLKNLLDRTAVSRDSQQLLLSKSATASSQAAKVRSTPLNPRVNDRHTELVQSTKSKQNYIFSGPFETCSPYPCTKAFD